MADGGPPTVERNVNAGSGTRTMSADFSQLTVADILPGLADKGRGISADIPLYGRASIEFAPDGAVMNATARLDLGAGNISFGENRDSILLDEATVKLRWDLPNKVLVVDPSTFFFGDTRGVVTGTISPTGDPKDRRYAFDLVSQGAILAPRDSKEAPIVAQRISVKGSADLPAKLLKIDSFELITPRSLRRRGRKPRLRRSDAVVCRGGNILSDAGARAEADLAGASSPRRRGAGCSITSSAARWSAASSRRQFRRASCGRASACRSRKTRCG